MQNNINVKNVKEYVKKINIYIKNQAKKQYIKITDI